MLPKIAIVLFKKTYANGLSPVMLRVSFQYKDKYYSAKVYSTPEMWDKENARLRKSHPTAKIDNERLRMIEERAHDAVRKLERDGIDFTFERFQQIMFPNTGSANKASVSEYLQGIADGLIKESRHGSARIYAQVSRVIHDFRPRSTMADIDEAWLHKFEAWLRSERPTTDGGIAVYFRTLRAACNRSIKLKEMPRTWYPFESFSLSHLSGGGVKKALTLYQIKQIESVELLQKTQQLARDLFIFSFYTRGMNLADIAELRTASIVGDRIVYDRKKTGGHYSVALNSRALAILERYRRDHDSHCFPIYTDGVHVTDVQKFNRKAKVAKQINKALREIAGLIGIPAENLSFYSARHSYATALLRKGVPVSVISEAMGHSDIKTTETYLKKFGSEVVDKADELLL